TVLIASFVSFQKWLDKAAIAPANNANFWNKLFGKSPKIPAHNRKACAKLSKQFGIHISQLKEQLHSSDESEFTVTTNDGKETSSESQASAGFAAGGVQAAASSTGSEIDR